jgi:galactan endo-1,6-beta-galactosidase
MRVLDTGVPYAAAAYDAPARRLVVVAVNTGAAQNLTFDLSQFSQVTGGAGGVVPRWSTVPGGADRYVSRQDLRLSGKTVRVPFPAASVQTIEVDGVVV